MLQSFKAKVKNLKVSVIVLRGGVTIDVDDARTTAGKVSMLEATSESVTSKSDAVDVKMFSGGGIVSVLKSGILEETMEGEMVEGSATLLVNVLVTVMNLETISSWNLNDLNCFFLF